MSEETPDEYADRMEALFMRINKSCEGEDMDDLVITLTRLVLVILEHMEPGQRRAMTHVVQEYIRASADPEPNTTLN